MSLPTYKTNRLLWFALSLICFLFGFDGIYFVIDLFSGNVLMLGIVRNENNSWRRRSLFCSTNDAVEGCTLQL